MLVAAVASAACWGLFAWVLVRLLGFTPWQVFLVIIILSASATLIALRRLPRDKGGDQW